MLDKNLRNAQNKKMINLEADFMNQKKIHPLFVARQARNMSLPDLAKLVGTDSGNLSRIENFKQKTSTELAEKIAGVFAGQLSEMHLLYPHRYATKQELINAS